ncbi:MAG: AAA family ATPase [Cyclobacteriaceae bacterium]
MIKRIEIEGYKSIRDLSLDLKPVNILLGGNGVGKSNFISLFTLIRNIYNHNFQNYVQSKGGADSLLHFGKKNTNRINLKLYFGNEYSTKNVFDIIIQEAQDTLILKSIGTAFQNYHGDWYPREFESNVRESDFANIQDNQAYYVNKYLKDFDVYHFHDTGDKSPMKGMSDLHDNTELRRNGSNIASFLYYLQEKHPKHFKRIELTIRSIAPFFDHFVLQPNRLNENKIQLEWREQGHPETYFSAYDLSDGTLRFICLTTLLMQPNPPSTIIIDEPELGLHPVAINKLAALVGKCSEESQIILSTQSTNLVDNFEPEDIIVTDRKRDGESTFRRLEGEALTQWLSDYTLSELWGQNKIGAQPYYN